METHAADSKVVTEMSWRRKVGSRTKLTKMYLWYLRQSGKFPDMVRESLGKVDEIPIFETEWEIPDHF